MNILEKKDLLTKTYDLMTKFGGGGGGGGGGHVWVYKKK